MLNGGMRVGHGTLASAHSSRSRSRPPAAARRPPTASSSTAASGRGRAGSRAQRLAVRRVRRPGVGTDAAARALAGPATEVVDLAGRFVAPGLNDAPPAPAARGARWTWPTRADVPEIQRRIAALRTRAHPGSPHGSRAAAGSTGAFPRGMPHKGAARRGGSGSSGPDDRLRRPHRLGQLEGAAGRAGITRETSRPATAAPSRATRPARPRACSRRRRSRSCANTCPPPSEEDKYRALKRRVDEACLLWAHFGLRTPSALGPPGVRARAGGGRAEGQSLFGAGLRRRRPPGTSWPATGRCATSTRGRSLKLGAVKGVVDGVVELGYGGHVRALRGHGRDRLCRTGRPPSNSTDGRRSTTRKGFQIFLHAIGDKAIHMAPRRLRARGEGQPHLGGRRHRVEHIEVPLPADLPSLQGAGRDRVHAGALRSTPTRTRSKSMPLNLGPDRWCRAPWHSGSRTGAGAVQAFGSDYPVFSHEGPWRGIHAAVTRTTPEGTPAGGWKPPGADLGRGRPAPLHVSTRPTPASTRRLKGNAGGGPAGRLRRPLGGTSVAVPARCAPGKAKVLRTVDGRADTFRAGAHDLTPVCRQGRGGDRRLRGHRPRVCVGSPRSVRASRRPPATRRGCRPRRRSARPGRGGPGRADRRDGGRAMPSRRADGRALPAPRQLVNNAGMSVGGRASTRSRTPRRTRRLMRVNYLGYCPSPPATPSPSSSGAAARSSASPPSPAHRRAHPRRLRREQTRPGRHHRVPARRAGERAWPSRAVAPDFVVSEIHRRSLRCDGQPLGHTHHAGVEDHDHRGLRAHDRALPCPAAGGSWSGPCAVRVGRWVRLVSPALIDRVAERAIRRGR